MDDPDVANSRQDAMSSQGVGEHRLGEYARYQLSAASRDPRLDRGQTAHLADFWDSMNEADRVRSFAIACIESTIHDVIDEAQEDAQSAWERSEMARRDRTAGHPFLNSTVLVGMFGSLDCLVERIGPSLHEYRTSFLGNALALLNDPEIRSEVGIDDATREAIVEMLGPHVAPRKQLRPMGPAPDRWERLLEDLGLTPRPGLSLPSDMINALRDFSALRDVITHRAGRIDEAAIRKSPRLASVHKYAPGTFVRIGREEYQRYSAALRAYGAEVEARLLARGGIDSGFDPQKWEGMHYVLA